MDDRLADSARALRQGQEELVSKVVRVAARVGNGPVHTDEGVTTKKATTTLEVPLKDIDTAESIALGFRSEMFTLSDGKKEVASAETTGGFGGRTVILTFRKRMVAIDVYDLLKRWVESFDPEEAKRLP